MWKQMSPLAHPKGKTPSRSSNLRKGVFCAFRRAKASPFGRGGTEGDGEGEPGTKEPLRSDGQALCQSDTIAVSELFGSSLALSVSSPCSSPALPKGEPLPERATVNLWKMHDRKEKNL